MRSSLNPLRRTRLVSTAVVALSCAAWSLVMSAQTTPLTLVSTEWPPFTDVSGQPRFALDLVEAALGRFGLTANTTIVGAAEFTSALTGGRFDGSAAAWKDPERERALVFSEPYLENRLVLIGRRGADVSATSMAMLKGKRIAIVEGYSYGDAIENTGPVFVRSQSEQDSLARLLKSEVDYTLMDDLVVQYIVSGYPEEARTRLAIGSMPLLTRSLHLAIRRSRPDADSIVTRFNTQLRGMIADRTYHRLLHVDWIRADVNGDGVAEFVPKDDKPGPTEPLRAYTLFSTPKTEGPKPGFYLGGSIYSDWASVPESYKQVVGTGRPDPRSSTASIFKFTW